MLYIMLEGMNVCNTFSGEHRRGRTPPTVCGLGPPSSPRLPQARADGVYDVEVVTLCYAGLC